MEIKQRVDKEYLIQLLNSYNVNLLSSAFDQLGILFTYQTISQAFFVFHCTMEFIAVEHKSTIQEKKMQYDLEKIIFSYSSYISFLIILELKFQHGLLQWLHDFIVSISWVDELLLGLVGTYLKMVSWSKYWSPLPY